MADMNKTAKIRDALKLLDPLNSKHWTDDGLPRESVVREYSGDATLSRAEISAAFPGFQRTKPQGAPATAKSDLPDSDPLTGDPVETTADPSKNTGELMTEDEVREILDGRVKAAEHALADAQQAVRDAHKGVENARAKLEAAKVELQREFPPLTEAQNIKQFLASEQAMRAARVEQHRAPARIDLVMQRSNSRGWRRPVRRGAAALKPVPSEGRTSA